MAKDKEEVCRICGGTFKRLNVHLRTKHGILRGDYERKYPASTVQEQEEDMVEMDTPETLEEPTNTLEETTDTLSAFLKDYNITKEELIELVVGKKGETKQSLLNKISDKMSKAKVIAEGLKNNDEVKTTLLDVSEILIKEYGFRHYATTSQPVKTWILKKI